MPTPASLYELHDIHLNVRWEHATLRSAGEMVLAYSGVHRSPASHPAPADAWCLTIAPGPAPERSLPREAVSRDAEGASLYVDAGRLVFVRGRSEAHVEPNERTATLFIASGDGAAIDVYVLLMYVLVAVVQEHGYTVLHAGALGYGPDADRSGLLFVAQSDSGKSTLTFGLIRQGWRFLTDDSVLLRLEDDEVVVRPFRWDGSVDPHAQDAFPEIADHRMPFLPSIEKWRVNLDTAFPGQRRTACVPRVLVFPSIEDVPESRLTPASRSEAFMHLLQLASVFALQRTQTDAQLDLLKHLVRQTRAYHLQNGHDLRDAPGAVADLLQPILT